MAAHHRHLGRAADVERLLADGVAATVADECGTVLVTVKRLVEPAPADTASGAALTVIAIDGEFDADTVPLLRDALMQALDARHAVCCDLSRVTFFGAAAANTLFAVHRHASERGRTFLVRGVQGLTRQIVNVIDPDGLITWLP
jgi:anti-anti-sigma factor